MALSDPDRQNAAGHRVTENKIPMVRGDAFAGSVTSVYSESSVDVALALIYIKSLRQRSSRSQGTLAQKWTECHFIALDQYQ
jgi:hypothetical protein